MRLIIDNMSAPLSLKSARELLEKYASPRGPLLAILAGHEHVSRIDDLSSQCKQYVTLPAFEGGHRKVVIEDLRTV